MTVESEQKIKWLVESIQHGSHVRINCTSLCFKSGVSNTRAACGREGILRGPRCFLKTFK